MHTLCFAADRGIAFGGIPAEPIQEPVEDPIDAAKREAYEAGRRDAIAEQQSQQPQFPDTHIQPGYLPTYVPNQQQAWPELQPITWITAPTLAINTVTVYGYGSSAAFQFTS